VKWGHLVMSVAGGGGFRPDLGDLIDERSAASLIDHVHGRSLPVPACRFNSVSGGGRLGAFTRATTPQWREGAKGHHVVRPAVCPPTDRHQSDV
jgi:hypothetical protein